MTPTVVLLLCFGCFWLGLSLGSALMWWLYQPVLGLQRMVDAAERPVLGTIDPDHRATNALLLERRRIEWDREQVTQDGIWGAEQQDVIDARE